MCCKSGTLLRQLQTTREPHARFMFATGIWVVTNRIVIAIQIMYYGKLLFTLFNNTNKILKLILNIVKIKANIEHYQL